MVAGIGVSQCPQEITDLVAVAEEAGPFEHIDKCLLDKILCVVR